MSFVYSALQSGVLHDNGYNVNNTDYFRCSVFARWVFTTNATRAFVKVWSTIYNSYPQHAQIEVRRGGVYVTTLECSAQGLNVFDVALTGTGQVELIAGAQSDTIGTFCRMVYFYGGSTAALVTPATPAPRLVIYGDSIAVGGDIPQHAISEAWTMLIRNGWNGSLQVEAWGGRKLADDCPDAGAATTFAARLASYSPTIVWLAIGTNDFGAYHLPAAPFGEQYANLLDALHSALPSAAIYAQSPLVVSDESANVSGSTMADFRTQINTACGTRAWATYVNGANILSLSDLGDSVHPTAAGHVKYAAAARVAMGI